MAHNSNTNRIWSCLHTFVGRFPQWRESIPASTLPRVVPQQLNPGLNLACVRVCFNPNPWVETRSRFSAPAVASCQSAEPHHVIFTLPFSFLFLFLFLPERTVVTPADKKNPFSCSWTKFIEALVDPALRRLIETYRSFWFVENTLHTNIQNPL